MAKVRCKETSMDSLFGNLLYEQKVSPNHFLRKLNEVDEDLSKGIKVGAIAADRGYDDREHHLLLKTRRNKPSYKSS